MAPHWDVVGWGGVAGDGRPLVAAAAGVYGPPTKWRRVDARAGGSVLDGSGMARGWCPGGYNCCLSLLDLNPCP